MSTSGAEIYKHIETLAQELGFADFGCAPAGELPPCRQEQYLNALSNGYFAKMEYLGRNLDKRFNPQLLVEGARSVLIFLAPYSLPEGDEKPEGFAQFALGTDYHIVIKERLHTIMEQLKKLFPGKCSVCIKKPITTATPCFANIKELAEFVALFGFSGKMTTMGTRYVDAEGRIYFNN